jgi:transposase-like protein
MSLLDFQTRFPTERECYEYLARMRFADGFVCPHCGSAKAGSIQTRKLWQCKKCRAQISLTAGTMFHGSRTPLRYWFWAIFLVAKDKRGHSALQLSKDLNIRHERAWLMLHKIRSAMAQRDAKYQLYGTIEMDEAYFGAPDRESRGRGTRRVKAIVAVGVTEDDKPGFAKIKIAKRLDRRSVKAFAKSCIASGSTVKTDGLTVYRVLPKLSLKHEEIVASGKSKDELLHWVHVVISNAKAFITGTFHGLGEKHMQRYLDEFCYRFNRRYREGELFDRLLAACVNAPPIIYDELTG